jgi:hypothetical protein
MELYMKQIIAIFLVLFSFNSLSREWNPEVSLNINYSEPMSDTIKKAFLDNGTGEADNGIALIGVRGVMSYKQRFKLGIDTKFGQTSEDENDKYGAFYYYGNFSFYTGYDVIHNDRLALTTGLLLGAGYENVDLFGTPLSGKWSEEFGFVEPELALEFKVVSMFSVALSGSYSHKFAKTTERLGDDLGITSKDNNFKFGLNFIISNFL